MTAQDAGAGPPLVELRGIVKVFPGVRANDGVDLTVAGGADHGLLGENGAGKTTLVSILYGLEQPDEGTISIAGEAVRIESPRAALGRGIAIVQQHFALVPTLTVAENVLLGQEGRAVFSAARVEQRVGALAETYGLQLDPGALVGELSIGERQRVEILKCLFREPRVIVFDEPTTVLIPEEIERLFATVRTLAAEGRGIVLITHKLDELMAVTDRITVLRAGRSVGTFATAEVDPPGLARLMVGRAVTLRSAVVARADDVALDDRAPHEVGAVVLELSGVGAIDGTTTRLDAVDLAVHAGEVVGLAGVEGNGQRELVQILCGTRRPSSGRVAVGGRDLTGAGPLALQGAGVRVVTEDRHATGLVLDMSVGENLVTDRIHRDPFSRRGLLSFGRLFDHAQRLIREFRVKAPGPATAARALSGGNQQRVVLARELSADVKVLVAAQPTRGLDVGAIEEVTERVIAARDGGAAVLLISSDLAEILALSDRVAVIHRGRLLAVLSQREATLDRLGPLLAGHLDTEAEVVA
ncbi:MAG: ABC transporter ATP-binding protein [Acidimicrobiales bacterium]